MAKSCLAQYQRNETDRVEAIPTDLLGCDRNCSLFICMSEIEASKSLYVNDMGSDGFILRPRHRGGP